MIDTPPKIEPIESRAAKMLREIFQSGRPLTYIQSPEEQRVERVLAEVARGHIASEPLLIWTWSSTEALHRNGQPAEPGTESPRGALDFIRAYKSPAIFNLKDFHEPMRESTDVRRRLRDVYYNCLDQQKFVVITSPVHYIPEELERNIIFFEMRSPDRVELIQFLRDETTHVTLSDDLLYLFAAALQGLTLEETRYALRRATANGKTLGPDSLPDLLEEKRLLINRSGVIEFIAEGHSLDEVGGLDGLKQWLLERRKLFQARDGLSEEIVPKGVLFMGIPGCGKSLCVKAISSSFKLPLYRVDMIEIFSGRHGKPEGAFVQACRTMEDMAPAILWFDEIEMGITSTDSSGEQGRIFAFFLTWMQEKARGLFVAATANRIDLLPAEMIRKGRFDEVFFVDLPHEGEQIEIFRIHLVRRGLDANAFNLAQLTKFTVGWSGAEIEQCVISSITKARLADRELTERDLIDVAVKIVPLSRTMKEQISKIRGWAFERAVKASPNPTGR